MGNWNRIKINFFFFLNFVIFLLNQQTIVLSYYYVKDNKVSILIYKYLH